MQKQMTISPKIYNINISGDNFKRPVHLYHFIRVNLIQNNSSNKNFYFRSSLELPKRNKQRKILIGGIFNQKIKERHMKAQEESQDQIHIPG